MTQPRKEQIKSVNTKYSYAEYLGAPGTSETGIAAISLNPWLTTDVPGGAETDVPGFVEGTNSSPFTILPGDAITVSLDGAPGILVTFAGTDVTASRVCAKINSLCGQIASNQAGRVRIRSITSGPDSSVGLVDATPGTLSKLGIVPGTYDGEGLARGVLTRSPDFLGGQVFLATSDGISLSTEAVHMVSGLQVSQLIRTVDIPAGLPVRGRLTATSDGSTYVFKYFANLPPPAQAVTFNSNFSLLDGTDSLSLTVDGDAMVVTFPGPPYTRDQVIDRINLAFAAYTGGFNYARVTASVTGPYNHFGSRFRVAVDGGAPIQVVIPSSADTAAEIVAALSAQVGGGITATTGGAGAKVFLVIQSNNTSGVSSSIEIIPDPATTASEMPSATFLRMLGFVPGLYRGSWIAEAYGPDEILIRSTSRGPTSALIVGGNPATLTRMGLSAGTVNGSATPSPSPVRLPRVVPDFLDSSTYLVRALVPEVEEFGDIPAPTDSRVQDMTARSDSPILQAFNQTFLDYGVSGTPAGLSGAGRSPSTNAFGSITDAGAQSVFDWFDNQLRQSVRLNIGRDVQAVVSDIFETPGTNGNTRNKSGFMIMDIDPDGGIGSNRLFRVRFSRDDVLNQHSPFAVVETPVTGLDWGADIDDTSGSSTTGFGNSRDLLRWYDQNTALAGDASSGDRFVPFSGADSAEGDNYVRILDAEVSADLVGKSVLHRLNAVMEVSVGDGLNSFGDFNGANALGAAIAFAASKSVTGLVVKLKRGTHSVTGAINVAASTSLRIEGVGAASSVISCTTAGCLSMGASSNLELSHVGVTKAAAPYAVVAAGTGSVKIADCVLTNAGLDLTNTTQCFVERTQFLGSGAAAARALVRLIMGDGSAKGPFTFTDCLFEPCTSAPVLFIQSAAAALATPVGPIIHERCIVNLASTTLDGNNNLVGNCGVVDLDPNGSDSLFDFDGVTVEHLEYRDCKVRANASGGGTVSVLIHLIPIANAAATTVSPYFGGSIPAMKVRRFVIDGGRWTAPAGNTLVNPFTVGLAWSDAVFTSNNLNSGVVEIRNAILEFDQTDGGGHTQGNPTQDVGSFFTTVQSPGGASPDFSIWGAFSISANFLTMRDVKMYGFGQLSGSGDLFLKSNVRTEVDGVILTDYQFGGFSTAPRNRVRLCFGETTPSSLGSSHSVRNVVLKGANAASGTWASSSLVNLEPTSNPTEIDGAKVTGFTIASSFGANAGLQLLDVSAFGVTSNPGTYDKLSVTRCTFMHSLTGIQALISTSVMREWSFQNNEIADNDTAVLLNSNVRIGALTFSGNRVHDNVSNGVFVGVTDWTSPTTSAPSVVCICDNVCVNNPGAPGVQMRLQTLNAGSQAPKGVIQGNVFHTITSTQASLQVDQTVGGVSTALTSPNSMGGGGPGILRGVETGHSITVATDYLFANGVAMIQNQGLLATP